MIGVSRLNIAGRRRTRGTFFFVTHHIYLGTVKAWPGRGATWINNCLCFNVGRTRGFKTSINTSGNLHSLPTRAVNERQKTLYSQMKVATRTAWPSARKRLLHGCKTLSALPPRRCCRLLATLCESHHIENVVRPSCPEIPTLLDP